MILSRTVFGGLMAVLLFSASLVVSGPVSAADKRPYSPAALAEAQSAGKSILVDVFASWCSTCRTQKPIVDALVEEPKYKDFVVLTADFDKDKDDLKALNVRSQATLIVFKGKEELVRSVGSTNPMAIEGQLDTAL